MNSITIVTGASGMLGNRLVERLTADGHRVIATANANVDLVWAKAEKVERCDLSNAIAVDALFSTYEPAFVVHAAALASVDLCEKQPALAYRHNVVATRNVTSGAARSRAQMVAVSTSSVFDGELGNYREDDTPNPRNYYSWTKLIAEEIAIAGCEATVVRATPIGIHPRRSTPANFLEWLVGQLRANADLNLFTDIAINPVSDVTLAEVIARLLTVDVRARKSKRIHVGTSHPSSKADIGRFIQAAHFTKYHGIMKCGASDTFQAAQGATRSKQMWLNVDEIEKLGIGTMPTIQAELERLASQFQ